MLTPEQLASLRSEIDRCHEALRVELRQDAARSRAQTYSEVAGPASDSGDLAAADVIADVGNADLSRDLRELRALEAARERLRASRYGICVDCGGDIAYERLMAQPAALRCLNCQRRYERHYAQTATPRL